jgi:hypothetical protein
MCSKRRSVKKARMMPMSMYTITYRYGFLKICNWRGGGNKHKQDTKLVKSLFKAEWLLLIFKADVSLETL